MKYRRPRSGDLATVDGREFPSSYLRGARTVRLFSSRKGVPDKGFCEWLPAAKQWYKPVSVDDCQRMVSVQVQARYRDVPVIVAKQWPTARSKPPGRGEISVLHVGGIGDMERRGFVRIDKMEYVARARIADLTDLVEEHADMLFRRRRASNPTALRTGMYAVLDGREYPARRAETNDHVELIESSGATTTSHVDELERLHDVSVHVRHANTNGGPTSKVVNISPEGTATLRSLHSGERMADRFGYRKQPDGWYTQCPLAELDVWHEIH
ncbi:MAG: hypothetical protein ACRD0P_07460, partial [Stackebrandtia sp.]